MLFVLRKSLFPVSIVCFALVLLSGSVQPSDSIAAVTRGAFTYRLDNPAYIDQVDSILVRTRSQLQLMLRDSLSFSSNVYLVESLSRFNRIVGGKFPEWGAAVAIPPRHLIAIKSPDRFNSNKSLRELVAHEYTHLALGHRLRGVNPPRWLNEGMAVLVSMEWTWGDNLTMNFASVTGDFVPLSEIERVNQFAGRRARLAYAESYLSVKYLFDEYGVEAVNTLLDRLAQRQSVDSALMASTGSNYSDFEEEFRVYLHQRYNLISLVFDTMYFWLGLAIILVIGGVLSIRRRRKQYEQWDEDEKLASTDFDYGDPDHPEQIDDDESWRE